MKLIFLDYDGVLNVIGTPMDTPMEGCVTNAECVANLNRITAATDARIVFSSSWRSDDNWREVLRDSGVLGEPLDRTPLDSIVGYPRERQIQAWLYAHGADVTRYAVLDDDSDAFANLPQEVRFRTDYYGKGLTREIADAVIAHLNG